VLGPLEKASFFTGQKRLAFSKGTNRVGHSPYFINLRMETDPVSETSCFKN
jgi:hypothetical protein